MSLPLHFLRPAAQGFAVGLLLAVAGCGVSSKPESAAVAPPAQGAMTTEALVRSEAVDGGCVHGQTQRSSGTDGEFCA